MPADSSQTRPDPGDPGDPGAMSRELTERFQELIERMNKLGQAGMSGMPNVMSQWMSLLEAGTTLSTLPVRQMQALVTTIRSQRDQVRGLQGQLEVFEQQLDALEKSLRPLVEWAEQWTQVQRSMLGQMREATKTTR